MAQRLRIGVRIVSADPFWLQVREEVAHKMQQLDVEHVPIEIGISANLPDKDLLEPADELLSQDLDALICTFMPDLLTAYVRWMLACQLSFSPRPACVIHCLLRRMTTMRLGA